MQNIKLDNGYIAYKVRTVELAKIGGYGICDTCNEAELVGYLVPVLNRWICEKCFEKWKSTCRHYSEDIPIEHKNCEYYEKMIPLTK